MRTPGISRSVLCRCWWQSGRRVCGKGGPRRSRNLCYSRIFSNCHGGCPRRSIGRLYQPHPRSRVPRLPAEPDGAAVCLGRVSRSLANTNMRKFAPECPPDLLIRSAAQLGVSRCRMFNLAIQQQAAVGRGKAMQIVRCRLGPVGSNGDSGQFFVGGAVGRYHFPLSGRGGGGDDQVVGSSGAPLSAYRDQ